MKKGWLMKALNRPLLRGLVKSIPFVGDIADNVLTETSNSPAGEFDPKDMWLRVVRLAILVVLLYLVFSGKIDMDQAEDAKEFLNN